MEVYSQHKKEKVIQLEDDFAIKNFVLVEQSEIPRTESLKSPLMFNGFIFGVCIKGHLQFRINHKTHDLTENEIFTILPNQIFKIIQDSPDLMIETLFLSTDYTLRFPFPKNFNLLKKIDDYPTQKVPDEEIHNILEIHSIITKHHQNEQNTYKDMMISGFIYALLMEIAYLYESSAVRIPKTLSRQEVLTDMFFKILLEHYIEERSVAFYAEQLCLTPKYLSMAVKKVTGHSIIDWINEAVIIEAKKRLKTTAHTVLQISEELNFPNPSFFGRFFKQYVGITPLEYRNQ
ncbi:MAG: AraC family transcriptional regulator [Tannerella sp.]|jgi:AraC-like DNA-binding protein|nr:AraC family transcriptional regulator [Tannerella sp.]